jgi:hypothetical protein
MIDKEGKRLAGEFHVAMLCDQIERLERLEEVKHVAKEMVRLNWQMKTTVAGMVERGWLEQGL